MRTVDLLVAGGGVVGLTAALVFARRHPGASVRVLEKEPALAAHGSGRNSGVLHAGLYYPPDSLKARMCRDGNRAWRTWCAERTVPLVDCGKVVVARHEGELAALDTIEARARANGVPIEALDEDGLRTLAPEARSVGRALFSPATAAFDPVGLMRALSEEARERGVGVETGVAWRGRRGEVHRTDAGEVVPGTFLNAAGLQADRVARTCGVEHDYEIMPFRGAFLVGEAAVTRHVYPVPDLDLPFLGVHLTVRAGGGVSIGPTAFPAWSREAYGGLEGLELAEVPGIVARGACMLARSASLRRLAVRELPLLRLETMVREASRLVPTAAEGSWRWGRAGIRAQLVSRRTGALEMDFVAEDRPGEVHVLNAVSPAFTSAWILAEDLADRLERVR